jgi:hypothetical protein
VVHGGQPIASSAPLAPISRAVVAALERFVQAHGVPLIAFEKRQRKDDRAREYLARFAAAGRAEGVLVVGKAQETAPVRRTEKRRTVDGRPYPWLVRATAPVDHYGVDGVARDCGPFVLGFCAAFPATAKLCLDGHESLERQPTRAGGGDTAPDKGLLAGGDPARAQAICAGLSAERIDAMPREWLALRPHPCSAEDRRAGDRAEVSILRAEFARTRVLDRPVSGRVLFEEVIRANRDLGRPDRVQLLVQRRVSKRTPGRVRARVLTEGVTPSLHVDDTSARLKRSHKEGRALRTETTVDNPRDSAIGARRTNPPALREVGFAANRRLPDVQPISHDCAIGDAALARVTRPAEVAGQRAAARPFTAPRVQALVGALVPFCPLPRGFPNRDRRERRAPLLGRAPGAITPGRVTDDRRRPRRHGLIERIPHTHHHRPTAERLRTALFCTRTHARLPRPGLSHVLAPAPRGAPRQTTPFARLEEALEQCCRAAKLVARNAIQSQRLPMPKTSSAGRGPYNRPCGSRI